MRENVLGLTAVLASGEVVCTGRRARKSSAGYDLTHLLVRESLGNCGRAEHELRGAPHRHRRVPPVGSRCTLSLQPYR